MLALSPVLRSCSEWTVGGFHTSWELRTIDDLESAVKTRHVGKMSPWEFLQLLACANFLDLLGEVADGECRVVWVGWGVR